MVPFDEHYHGALEISWIKFFWPTMVLLWKCGWPLNFNFWSVNDDVGENERVSPIHSPTRHSSDSCNGFPKCLLLNIRSLRNKIEDLHALLLTDSFDVTILTKTWLDEDFHYGELHLDGYNIFRCDRCGWGSGVLLATKSHKKAQKIVTCDFTTNAKNHQTCDFLQDTKNDNFSAVCKPGHKCALAHPYFHIHIFEGIQFSYKICTVFCYLDRYVVLAEIGQHNQQSWSYFS